jgi:hypothetical protein
MVAHSQPEDPRQSLCQRMRFGDFERLERLERRQKPSSAGGAIPRGELRGAPFRRGISTSGASKGVCSVDRGRSTAECFQGRPSHAQWATVFAASSIADTVTSGCAIMLGWSPPGTWRTFDFARVANLFRISGGMTLSASPMTYHEGIVFQPIAAGALSVSSARRKVAGSRPGAPQPPEIPQTQRSPRNTSHSRRDLRRRRLTS